MLRNTLPEKRLLKALELSEFSKRLFVHGLRKRFPDLDEEESHRLYPYRLDKCHNRNWREGSFELLTKRVSNT